MHYMRWIKRGSLPIDNEQRQERIANWLPLTMPSPPPADHVGTVAAALVGRIKSNANDYTAIHLEPAWRARANFIIAAEIGGTALRPEREQLWARQTDEFCFELCCIPFFVYDLALAMKYELISNT